VNRTPFDDGDPDPLTVKILLMLDRLGLDCMAEQAPDGTVTLTYNVNDLSKAVIDASPPTRTKQ
jgi:hypothetical protein